MDSFEINKLIGALLGTVFVVFSITLVADSLFAAHPPEKPGYVIEVAETEAGAGAVEEKEVPIATLLQDADPEAGASVFRKCQACHTGDQGGANKVGPNLWGIVNRPVASHEGFSYSAGMKEFAGTVDKWDYEHLNHFLTGPKAYVKGTAMAFVGLKKPEDRANVLSYLRTLADNPAPLPEPPAAEEESAQAPTGDDAAAAPADNAGEGSGDAAVEGESTEQAPVDAAPESKNVEQTAPTEEAPADGTPAEVAPGEEPAD